MIKLKDILSEAYAWERQEGKALPTLAEVQAAYDAKMREDASIDPEEEGHVYEEPPYDPDEDEDDMFESKAAKDYDGDGEIESGSEEYLGSRDKAIKAAADTTAYGNYVNKARAKSQLTNKDVCVYGITGKTGTETGTEITNASDLDKYTKFTVKSKSVKESLNSRILNNLRGSEYILSETFKK